jgi:hypothetical protein
MNIKFNINKFGIFGSDFSPLHLKNIMIDLNTYRFRIGNFNNGLNCKVKYGGAGGLGYKDNINFKYPGDFPRVSRVVFFTLYLYLILVYIVVTSIMLRDVKCWSNGVHPNLTPHLFTFKLPFLSTVHAKIAYLIFVKFVIIRFIVRSSLPVRAENIFHQPVCFLYIPLDLNSFFQLRYLQFYC